MKYFISAFILIFSLNSFGFNLSSEIFHSEHGEVKRAFTFQCSQDESFCFSMCGNSRSCLLNYESCEGCASAGHLKLVSIFQNLSQFYKSVSAEVGHEQLLNELRSHQLAALDSDSIFNLLSDALDDKEVEKTKLEFLRLCPIKSENAYILATPNFTPQMIVCQTSGRSAVFSIQVNPEFQRLAP